MQGNLILTKYYHVYVVKDVMFVCLLACHVYLHDRGRNWFILDSEQDEAEGEGVGAIT